MTTPFVKCWGVLVHVVCYTGDVSPLPLASDSDRSDLDSQQWI